MPNDPIETLEGPKRGIVCEFCECQLSASGDIVKRSTRARAFIDLDDDNAKLRARVEALTADVAAAKADADAVREQLAAAQPAPKSSRSFIDLD